MNAAATNKAVGEFDVLGWAKLVGFGILVFITFKLLRKFNIIGTNPDTEEAKALGEDKALAQVVTNITSDPQNPFLTAIKKKFGTKPTAAQLNSLLPNKPNYGKLILQIQDAHDIFSPNEADKIFGAFRQLKSQYEVNFFATTFSIATKGDMYGALDKLMRDSDMAKLRTIINSKPII